MIVFYILSTKRAMIALYIGFGFVALIYVCAHIQKRKRKHKRRIVPTALGPRPKFEIYDSQLNQRDQRDLRASTL